jgi:methylated-DNA-[protein]-cysteine S-methyltransferase
MTPKRPFEPNASELSASRQKVQQWFVQTAPRIEWAAMDSPLGTLYLARNTVGLCHLNFGISEDTFMAHIDPLARTHHNRAELSAVMQQLDEYFEGQRQHFEVPVDYHQMTDFQQQVLQTAEAIPPGQVWTYAQLARHIGKPRASRAVGNALGSNPIPIIVPCHRIIGSDGQMRGYSGGGGIASKKWLLHLEGAL